MEKWEYQTRFFEARANKKEIRTYIKDEFDKRAKRHSPEAMIPELNELGELGWEIIHMEPVARVGSKENILFDNGYRWSNTFFCVMKRRKPGSSIPAEVINQPEPVKQQSSENLHVQSQMAAQQPSQEQSQPARTPPISIPPDV